MTSSLFYWELSPGVLLRQVNVDPLLKPEQQYLQIWKPFFFTFFWWQRPNATEYWLPPEQGSRLCRCQRPEIIDTNSEVFVLHQDTVLGITCICTRNSVLILRADSDSLSERDPHNESTWTARESMKKTNKQKSGSINELITSSMKMMLGLCSRAISKRFFTNFSDSPNHLLTKSLLDTEKKVELLASVATAFAR